MSSLPTRRVSLRISHFSQGFKSNVQRKRFMYTKRNHKEVQNRKCQRIANSYGHQHPKVSQVALYISLIFYLQWICVQDINLYKIMRILKCLKGTVIVGLWYLRTDTFGLVGHCSHYVRCKLGQKSTNRGYQFLCSFLISCSSKKQYCVALSLTKAKYIARDECIAQLLALDEKSLRQGSCT